MSKQQQASTVAPSEPGPATRVVAVQGGQLGRAVESGSGERPGRVHSRDLPSRHTAYDGWAAQCHRPDQRHR